MELPKYFYFRLHPSEKGTAVEIEDASDADVVEIIRCKDCKHREHCRTSTVWAVAPADDWYCADAEPKGEQE